MSKLGCLNCIFWEPKYTLTLKCTCDEGTPVMYGHFLRCPLVTGFTVSCLEAEKQKTKKKKIYLMYKSSGQKHNYILTFRN